MKKRALIYIILAGVLWGTSGIFVHYLAPYGFTTLQMTAVRATIAVICICLYLLLKDRSLFRIRRAHLLLTAAIGLCQFLTANCYYLSMQLTSVSTAVVLMYTAPLYVAVYSAVFFGERLTRSKTLSIGAMLIGCCLVSGIVGGAKFNTVGILIGIASGITYAAYNVLVKISVSGGARAETVTLYSFGFMALIALPFSEPTKLAASVSPSPTVTLPLLLGLGICTFVLPYFFYTLSMRDLSASVASAMGIIEPMAAMLYSVIIFDEKLNLFSVLGTVMIICAVVVISISEQRMDIENSAEPEQVRETVK